MLRLTIFNTFLQIYSPSALASCTVFILITQAILKTSAKSVNPDQVAPKGAA